MRNVTPDRVVGVLALVLAVTAPFYVSAYWVGALLTQMLFLGIVAASLIFLSAYGGMVSLAQVSMYGIAGFVLGNATTNGNTKGLNLGWNPWWGVLVGILFAVGAGLLFGALASRSVGIYFLMITLTYSVIANLVFGQVTDISGFGGISGIPSPRGIGPVDAHQNRLYYVALVVAFAVYVLLRYIARTPFGLTLAGRSRRSRAHVVARLQRRAAPDDRVRVRLVHRRDRRRAVRLVERAHRSRRRSISARRSTCS